MGPPVSTMLRFSHKPELRGKEQPLYDGQYVVDHDRGLVNNKPVYVNSTRKLLLAAHPESGWCITGLHYWETIQTNQGRFGGFCFGGEDEPHTGTWKSFDVDVMEVFNLSAVPGGKDDGRCCGDYVIDESKGHINGKPVYINSLENRFMAAQANSTWVITGMDYFSEVQSKQGIVGGFAFGGGNQPDDNDWKNYVIQRKGGKPKPVHIFGELKSWCRLENTTVSFKACANTGVVRSESDFAAVRKRCIALNCGGFVWRKPHHNQFGEEDDPPICFFYRKTQHDIRNATRSDSKFDLYIVCDDFCPDCSFKSGQESAPSCHIRWNVRQSVFGFACQVVVTDPVPTTYYCAAGFDGGYSGIQQHTSCKQQMLFSLWDHPCGCDRVKSSSCCQDVITKQFGGEGKGMQAIAICGGSDPQHNAKIAKWLPNVPYTFVVRAYATSDGTKYTCDVFKPESGWQLLATHTRPEPAGPHRGKLSGLYSFIEDFGGNSIRRSAVYAAWVQDTSGGSWRTVDHITGTSTAEDDVPNKCVKLVTDSEGFQRVEMITGGDVLPDFSLCKGAIAAPPPPNMLYQL